MRLLRHFTSVNVALVIAVLVAPLVATTGSAGAAAAPAPLAPGVSAYFEMNEAPGTTVMQDSGPNHLDAPVDPTGISSGVTVGGATGYNWAYRPPEQAPASPERVIQIPDNSALEPGDGPFTIELRYRTSNSFGNITQKGQSASVGGQWKIQAPGGVPSCLFKGSAGQVATASTIALDDEAWHNLTCVYNSTGVALYVDGVYRSRKNGTAGTINNSIPMTIGGKINCDQVDITCDYFSGGIDFLKITQAANLLPTSAFTNTCFGQVCNFDSSTAADADGSLTRYLWDFGDGTTSTDANPQHTYAAPGPYAVRLTVTDNQASTDFELKNLTVEPNPPLESSVDRVGSVMSAANNSAAKVVIPATAVAGDRLVMVLGYNTLSRTVSDPTGSGWTRLGALTAGTMGSVAWTKVVAAGDPGTTVTVPLSGAAKYTLSLSAYTGVAPGALTFANATDTIPNSSRTTPTVSIPVGSWVASYWSDKSSTTTAWTPEAAVTTRLAGCNADGGRICSALADSNGPLPGLPYGHIAASTNAASDYAAMWSFVLAPETDSNQAPTATFSTSCTLLDCSFNGASSSDPDGSIVAYDWDFGDGATSTLAAPTHTYAPGTYNVTLTVTDNEGATDDLTSSVTVAGAPADSPVAYVGSTSVAGSNATPSVPVPAGAVIGDRLIYALSLNSTTRTFTGPSGPGWTQLDDKIAGDMRTVFWTKAVAAGDPASVSVPLSGAAKYTATIAAYTGVASGTPTFSSAIDTSNHTNRLTPAVDVPEGAWVVSYWSDKSSTTTGWTLPGTVTSRSSACGDSTGRICSAFADSGHSLSGRDSGRRERQHERREQQGHHLVRRTRSPRLSSARQTHRLALPSLKGVDPGDLVGGEHVAHPVPVQRDRFADSRAREQGLAVHRPAGSTAPWLRVHERLSVPSKLRSGDRDPLAIDRVHDTRTNATPVEDADRWSGRESLSEHGGPGVDLEDLEGVMGTRPMAGLTPGATGLLTESPDQQAQ